MSSMYYPGQLIKVQIEDMKHQIATYLTAYHKGVGDEVERQIEEAIKEFDFPGNIKPQVNKTIEAAIEDYFRFGEGKRVITEAVWESMDKMLVKEE